MEASASADDYIGSLKEFSTSLKYKHVLVMRIVDIQSRNWII